MSIGHNWAMHDDYWEQDDDGKWWWHWGGWVITAEKLWLEIQIPIDSIDVRIRYPRTMIVQITDFIAIQWCIFMDGWTDLGESIDD